MRALSFWQPHGSLILTLAKPFETRGYPTNVRGDVLLHGAKNRTHICYLQEMSYQQGLQPLVGQPLDFTARPSVLIEPCHIEFGCLLGVAELIGCYKCEDMTEEQRRRSRGFGDFAYGRYAWEFANVRKLEKPIPYKGAQGFFFASLDLRDNKLIKVRP